jgi:hypothetical protein
MAGSLGMLRYINSVVCAARKRAQGKSSSASFYYILGFCGAASATLWCNAAKFP